jgi:DNA-directed RNA polymerase sigma subunit (sigma70/sigma32)
MSKDARLRGYLDAVDRLPSLTDREIGDLAETIQRCREIDDLAVGAPAGPSAAEAGQVRARSQAARKRLIEGNLRAVVVIADQYREQGLSLHELLEAGNRGGQHRAGAGGGRLRLAAESRLPKPCDGSHPPRRHRCHQRPRIAR